MKNLSPTVSILIAARNEVEYIASCIEAILKNNFPLNNLEILIGDDESSDGTGQIIQSFEKQHPHLIKYFYFTRNAADILNGKAAVLAKLVKKAQGSFFLFTDADVLVCETWVASMHQLLSTHAATGIASGITIPSQQNFFAKLQSLEWLIVLHLVSVASDFGLALTAPGNNMAIKRQAYFSTEGFKQAGTSVTEDHALLKLLTAKDWKLHASRKSNVYAFTNASSFGKAYFQQRLRWLTGALASPWWIQMCIVLLVTLPLSSILLWLISFSAAVYSLIALAITGVGLALWVTAYHKQYDLWYGCFLFPAYLFTFPFIVALGYVTGITIQWKGRTY